MDLILPVIYAVIFPALFIVCFLVYEYGDGERTTRLLSAFCLFRCGTFSMLLEFNEAITWLVIFLATVEIGKLQENKK